MHHPLRAHPIPQAQRVPVDFVLVAIAVPTTTTTLLTSLTAVLLATATGLRTTAVVTCQHEFDGAALTNRPIVGSAGAKCRQGRLPEWQAGHWNGISCC